MREAVGTSALSPRWRFVWTSMPHLNFSSEGFSRLPKFFKFVTHVMNRLWTSNDSAKVYSVKLSLCGEPSQLFVKKILDCVLSHSIQQLEMVCLLKNDIEFPLSFYSSESIKHLNVKMERITRCGKYHGNGNLTSSLELPALTTLDLHSVTLCDENADTGAGVLSKCANLENLSLRQFAIKGSNSLSITLPRLSNLTLEQAYCDKAINVATPHLKILTIRSCYAKFVISAPDLTNFYEGPNPWKLSIEGFHSLEKAHIRVLYPYSHAHEIVCLLQWLRSVKFLTLNFEIVELLSSSAGPFLPQPSPFVNLKSLKIYPGDLRL